VTRAADDRLEAGDDGVTREEPTRERKVRRSASVERAEPADAVGAEALRAPSRAADEVLELPPGVLSLPRETI
jgi:hypothetical protein